MAATTADPTRGNRDTPRVAEDRPAPRVPLLENGDQLHAGEFLRRYEAMPDLKKAELIQGIVYISDSLVKFVGHGQENALLQGWLGIYAADHENITAASNPTTKLGPEDVPQPDGVLIRTDETATAKVDEDRYLQGPPELVVEIASSSVSRDSGIKKQSYLRAGVREYLLWRTDDRAIDWWHFNEAEGDWEALEPDPKTNRIASQEFPGLVLDTEAALALDAKKLLAALKDCPEDQ